MKGKICIKMLETWNIFLHLFLFYFILYDGSPNPGITATFKYMPIWVINTLTPHFELTSRLWGTEIIMLSGIGINGKKFGLEHAYSTVFYSKNWLLVQICQVFSAFLLASCNFVTPILIKMASYCAKKNTVLCYLKYIFVLWIFSLCTHF